MFDSFLLGNLIWFYFVSVATRLVEGYCEKRNNCIFFKCQLIIKYTYRKMNEYCQGKIQTFNEMSGKNVMVIIKAFYFCIYL